MAQGLLHTDESVAQRVAVNMREFADNKALHIGNRYYTYRELHEITRAVYAQIPAGKCYDRIGIYCSNDVYTYASILAAGLYGAAYVPLNRNFPVLRNKRIVADCSLELVLGSIENEDVKEISDGVEYVPTGSALQPANSEAAGKTEQKTCYILFTSGSTGDAKGVPVSNENVRSFFNYFLRNYDFNEQDRFLQTYELTFDVSVFSFFMPLLVGACCYVLPEEGIKPLKIAEYLLKHDITVVSMVPGVLSYLDNYFNEISLPHLRYSFFSGDALYHDLAVKWSASVPHAAIHNFYGPTETTIVCTRYIFDPERSAAERMNGIVPLGKAFEGMEFMIVNEDLAETGKGELCFFGTQVIGAYLNDANEDKFFVKKQKRYYKTGDIASVNEQGNLIFHGRTDSQVKINGYRVELAEVEHAVQQASGQRCVVMCVKTGNLNRLIAFFEATINEAALREKLSELIPGYMIPQEFISVTEFPLNANGKTDRKALINAYI
jgi:amino acid adenylation domain-containing protein